MRRIALFTLLLLAGCDAQMKTSAIASSDRGTHLEMNNDDDRGQPRLQEAHEYDLGGVELKSR